MKLLVLLVVFITAFELLSQNPTEYKDDFSRIVWNNWKSDNAVGEFLLNKEEGHDGKGALEIAVGKDNPSSGSFCFTKRFPVFPGRTYNAVVWVKVEGLDDSGHVTLGFQGLDKDGKFLGTPVIAARRYASVILDGWQRLILTFKVPNEGLWAKTGFLLCTLGIEKSSQGKVLFDDFEFFETK
ncbi:MAG: hypothetical protein A4E71_00038 [Smithella sp. PtaU1.Bin162]|nr:MAG: hypothetical protein A4E71_00038 [Smithella sp. PtaU1.Bin162]